MSQPMTVTVGPLATASATRIAASQKAAAARPLVLNGAGADAVANSICLSQTASAAGPLILNGSTATTNMPAGAGGTASPGSAVAYIVPARRIYITSSGNDSGVTFTVVGTVQTPTSFGLGAVVTEVLTGANASTVSSTTVYSTIISITISAASAGTVTVGSNGLATLDMARRVLLTSAGNDSGITFTLIGADWNGNMHTEVVTGANAATAVSLLDFLTVTSIVTSGAVATSVTVGTNGVATAPWVRFDNLAGHAQVAIQCTVSGTVNYTVQQTLEDPNIISNQLPTPTYRWTESAITWVDHPDSGLVAATTTKQGRYDAAPVFARVVLNSGTGSVTGTFVQAYLR